MFRFGRKSAAKHHISREVYAIREMCEREGKLDAKAFWTDPYFTGYANGVHSILSSEYAEKAFSVSERSRMWIDVVIENKGNVERVLSQMMSWTATNDDFERGSLDGITVKLLQLNKLPVAGEDTDVKWAIEQASVIQQE